MLHLQEGEWTDDQPSWPAFVDLLSATALILVSVITVLIVTMGRRLERERMETEGLRTQHGVLLARLKESSENEELFRVISDGQVIRVVLSSDVTFPRNEWTIASIKHEGRRRLEAIGRVLSDSATVPLYRQVSVTGHTDQLPFNEGSPTVKWTNWELSAARAAAVARYLVERARLTPCVVGASGRGAYYPHYPNVTEAEVAAHTDDAMATNRRIEIEIIPALVSRSANQPTCYPAGDGHLVTTRPAR